MGIGDWFKRFKGNAAALEEYREGVAQPQDTGESQAERAAHEGAPAQQKSASTDENRGGGD